MNRNQGKILQWARGVRDFFGERAIKANIAELTTLTKELDDAVGQLTAGAAAQEAITKQARVQTTEIKRLREALRNTLKPIVRMSRTMKLEINGTEITFVLPNYTIDSERLAAAADAMVTALGTFGPQFVARGLAADFVEQVSSATKALRDAIDARVAQVSRRTGTTATMLEDENQVVRLVRLIDTVIRPVIQNDPGQLAAWDNVVTFRQTSRAGGVVAQTPPAASTPAASSPATPVVVSSETPQAPKVVA